MIKQVGTSSAFFKGLSERAEDIAIKECKDLTDMMGFILTHRMQLKGTGNGRFPKWDGSNNKESNMSFRGWSAVPYGKYFALKHTNHTKFNYVRFLVNGAPMASAPRGWFESALRGVTQKGDLTKLTITNGRVFSTQMQHGLNPWLKIKKEDLKNNIRQAFMIQRSF